jgi:uncharacterized protein GlcG (DUF336 family)
MFVISSSPYQRSYLTKSTPTDAPSFIKAEQENSTSIELYCKDFGSGPPASYRSSVTGRAKVTRTRFLLSAGTTIAAMFLLLSHSAEAQVAKSGYSLPLSLAVEAATEAIRSCEAHGYAVSASVVDTSGVVKVQLKGDHSTVHTQDTSFRKAYTLVTFGPIFNLDTSTQIAELAKNPAGPGPALTSIPNVLALAGGVAIKRNNEIVATLGVGGSPGGANDEACAEAGVAKIHDRVEAAAAPMSRSADIKK